MTTKYKFQQKTGQETLDQIFREVEDNFANNADLDDREASILNLVGQMLIDAGVMTEEEVKSFIPKFE